MNQTETSAAKRACKATTKTGQPCRSWALNGSEFCFAHDPAIAADRQAARKRGGQARHGRALHLEIEKPPAALNTPGDMLAALEYGLSVALALEPSHAQVRSIVAVVTAAAKLREIGEFETRLSAIEAHVFGHERAKGHGQFSGAFECT